MSHKQRIQEVLADVIPESPTVLGRHATNTGEIQLQHRLLADGSDVFEIISDGVFLMSSQFHLGERVLAQQALLEIEQHLHADRRVLIGGLGMGFTLQETLEHAVAKVDIVEISNHVIDWNHRFFTPLNKRALSDPRTHLIQHDLFSVLNEAKPATYAAIILDVDNGPSWLAHGQNARLYTDEALATWSTLLVPNGVLAVWSAQTEVEFMERMKRHFRDVEEATVLLPGPKDQARNDYVYRGIRCQSCHPRVEIVEGP
jgi:spermidine synthase